MKSLESQLRAKIEKTKKQIDDPKALGTCDVKTEGDWYEIGASEFLPLVLKLYEELSYYADPANKVHVSKVADDEDEEIGNFVLPLEDHSWFVGTEYKGKKYFGWTCGKRARAAIAEIDKLLEG